MTRPLLLLALVLTFGCKRAEKPPQRTEPWLAHPSASAPATSPEVERYELAEGNVRVELRGPRGRATATLGKLEGQLTLNPVHLEKTRGEIRADLLSLDFEDPSLDLSALRALELEPDVPNEARERDRFAKLRVVGFENPRPSEGTSQRRGPTSAFVELTLHRFRVPLTLELAVERSPKRGAPLRVRTRRPIVVDLAAHDLVAEDRAPGTEVARGASSPGYREARVSAELSFRSTDFTAITPNKP